MSILTVYDVTGIQKFIFSSSKLKENFGGSLLVAKVMEELLVDAIGLANSKVCTDWKNSPDFRMLNDHDIDAEIVYIGGGNAYVAYKDKATAIRTTKEFSKKVFEETYSLTVLSASVEADFEKDDYKIKMKELQKTMGKKKNEFIRTSPLKNISITKESLNLKPVTKKENDEFLDVENVIKRNEFKNYHDIFNNEFLADSTYMFPKEIENMGQKTGENHIAVVHIDGNNMGKSIEKALKNIQTFREAVPKMRQISRNITEQYRDSFRQLITFLISKIEDEDSPIKKLNFSKENNKTDLPIRPIILNGDDTTFVCNARIAMCLTEKFLQIIDEKEIELLGRTSACGGIAIIGTHFPFDKAYELTEECCASAKKTAKEYALTNNEDVKSWFDFHIVYGGLTSDLQTIREKTYNVVDLPPIKDSKIKKYHLLNRPFIVTEKDHNSSFEKFVKTYEYFFGKDTVWARSKLKELRNAMIQGKQATDLYLKELKSRGKELPDTYKGVNNGFFEEGITPFFDILEASDYFIDISDERRKE